MLQLCRRSVCVPIGGFRESKYLGSYGVVVRRRTGFARLALETGAALVPVLGIGEAEFCGEAPDGYISMMIKTILP
jgi:hypothetical protein